MDRQDLIAAPRELLTPRLHLLGPRPEHAAVFVESLNLSLPGLRFISWGREAHDLVWAERFMQNALLFVETGDCLVFHAFVREGGAYVGRIDLHSWDFDAPRCEVGYVGDVRTAGRGLMREAVLATVELAFTLGAARVQALSEIGNARALHFAEHALGFTREGVLRHYERDAHGKLGEQVMFAAYNPRAA